MDATLTSLLAEARRVGSIPNTAATGSQDADLIAELNQALVGVAAEIVKCREGFYRRYSDQALSSTQVRYRIPTRAIGNRLAAVLLLDSSGKVLRKLDELPYGAVSNFRNVTDTMGYHLEAGDVVLTPAAPCGTAVTLRMVYYARPSQLSSSLDTASGDCFTVTGVSGNVLSLASSHGVTTATRIDVIHKDPPFEALTTDELPTATSTTTVTVADGSRVNIGDFICLADKAPVAQVPDAFYPVLAAIAAMRFWMALGDTEHTDMLDRKVYGTLGAKGIRHGGLMTQAIDLISPRVEEGARKIMSPYGALGALYGPARRVY